MLWKASALGEFDLRATDGGIGAIRDCLFDPLLWVARWFVVDTGTWLPGREVLIAPGRIDASGTDRLELRLDISREQVRASPPFEDRGAPSRHYEARLVEHYGWQSYWLGIAEPPAEPEAAGPAAPGLRSTSDMLGFHIHARDGRIGHVDDFLIDPEGWALRYVVVDTRDWWPGRRVLAAPPAVSGIDWQGRTIELGLTGEQIRNGPPYDPAETVDRVWEERFHGYYGFPVYW